MIDIQKAVRSECVQFDEFGDKYIPKKTITAIYAINISIASLSFPLILTTVLRGWRCHNHFENREAVLETWSNIPKLTQQESRVQILTLYHKISSSILSYFHTYPRGTYWILHWKQLSLRGKISNCLKWDEDIFYQGKNKGLREHRRSIFISSEGFQKVCRKHTKRITS